MQQLRICLNKLQFFTLNQLRSLLSSLCFSIASIATLLSVCMWTWELLGAASNAVQIAPNSARVDEGYFSKLQLKLISLTISFSNFAIHPIPILFPVTLFISIAPSV